MSLDVSTIIPVTSRLNTGGIGFANFGSATMFSPLGEAPSGVTAGSRRVYNSLAELGSEYTTDSETYKALTRWFSNIPRGRQATVYTYDDSSPVIGDILNQARDRFYWFWSFFPAQVLADSASADAIASWSDANDSFFINCQTGANAAAIRDINATNDMATDFSNKGYRHTHTSTHASDPYAGISLATWFGTVNYAGTNTTITGEYKRLTGVEAEDLGSTEIAALKAKNAGHYGIIELQGQIDRGRYINSITHSAFGEHIDRVVDLCAYVNAKKVRLYNTIANSPGRGKLPLTIDGQRLLISASEEIGEQFITNGYLGRRSFTDPDTGLDRISRGYDILTLPEDIDSLTPEERQTRFAAPMREYVFPADAIHGVALTLDIF